MSSPNRTGPARPSRARVRRLALALTAVGLLGAGVWLALDRTAWTGGSDHTAASGAVLPRHPVGSGRPMPGMPGMAGAGGLDSDNSNASQPSIPPPPNGAGKLAEAVPADPALRAAGLTPAALPGMPPLARPPRRLRRRPPRRALAGRQARSRRGLRAQHRQQHGRPSSTRTPTRSSSTFRVGASPQHVVPSWDLKTLWVNNDLGNTLTAIDPAHRQVGQAGPRRTTRTTSTSRPTASTPS